MTAMRIRLRVCTVIVWFERCGRDGKDEIGDGRAGHWALRVFPDSFSGCVQTLRKDIHVQVDKNEDGHILCHPLASTTDQDATMTSLLFSDSTWTTESALTTPPKVSDDGAQLELTGNDRTDWWHTLDVNSTDGAVYGFTKIITKEGWEISVDLKVDITQQVSG
jgi:hypothetical protein